VPETTTTINRDQRDGLYEVICNHLSQVQDFWVAMQRTKDGATAERLGLEFAEDFRLLQDTRCKLRDAGVDGFVVNYRERGYRLCEGHAAGNGGPQHEPAIRRAAPFPSSVHAQGFGAGSSASPTS
jgi:hypothetical protein